MSKSSNKVLGLVCIVATIMVWGCVLAGAAANYFGGDESSPRALRRNPDPLIAQAREAIDRGDLASARQVMNRLDVAGAVHGLDDAYTAKRKEQEAQAAMQAEAARLEDIRTALASEGCNLWAENSRRLRQLKADEVTPETKLATQRLEECRLASIKQAELAVKVAQAERLRREQVEQDRQEEARRVRHAKIMRELDLPVEPSDQVRRGTSSSRSGRSYSPKGGSYRGRKNCKKGCPCGHTCISCAKTCHISGW